MRCGTRRQLLSVSFYPVMSASWFDITRSAACRVNAESVWLPSILCGNEVSWKTPDSSHLYAGFKAHNQTASLQLAINGKGRLESIKLSRWGNPEGAEFHYVDFGGIVDEEGNFDGYTIPTRLRIGWYYGTDRFKSDGEFFRVTIDEARYR